MSQNLNEIGFYTMAAGEVLFSNMSKDDLEDLEKDIVVLTERYSKK